MKEKDTILCTVLQLPVACILLSRLLCVPASQHVNLFWHLQVRPGDETCSFLLSFCKPAAPDLLPPLSRNFLADGRCNP
jgi:hypothetical protein